MEGRRRILLQQGEGDIFITRQPPIVEKDDYDSENSWISEGLSSSSRRRRRGEGRGEGGGGKGEREGECEQRQKVSR